MPFAELRDGRLYYEVHGTGAPLMLVSGLGGNASFWSSLVHRFARRFQVVVHDHRGAGQSTMSRVAYSAEQFAQDVLALMDHLGIDRTDFVGHSMGGAIGQVLAIEQPQRLNRLVISSSWTSADAYYRRLFEARRDILDRQGVEAYFRASILFFYPPQWIAGHADETEAAVAAMVEHAPPIEIMRAKIDAVLKFDRTAELGRIRTPTLINCASDDMLTPAYFSRALAEAIPRAQLRLMRTGAHFNVIAAAGVYFRQVSAFLEDADEKHS
jgi:aminoacrylate hydrolase